MPRRQPPQPASIHLPRLRPGVCLLTALLPFTLAGAATASAGASLTEPAGATAPDRAATAAAAGASAAAESVQAFAAAVTTTAHTEVAATAAERLHALFAASDEASLARDPLRALFRGDTRYTGEFGDYISDAYLAAERQAALDDLAALRQIPRDDLTPADQISLDVFQYRRTMDLRATDPALLAVSADRPIDHFTGLQTMVPDLSSGNGAGVYATAQDYEDGLHRLDGYVRYLDRAIARMRHGLAVGNTNPRLVMENVVGQFDALIAEGVEGSVFYQPVLHFPGTLPGAERQRLTLAYQSFIRDRLQPAQVRMRDFLRQEYLPHARTSVGLSALPGGAALYRYLVALNTTLEVSPETLHTLGEQEVARITDEMNRARMAAGFSGDLAAFGEFLRTAPQFAPTSAEDVRDRFLQIRKRVDAVLARDFTIAPRTALEIRPVPAYKERTEAAGSYFQGTPDGQRPGIFFYNTYDLPSRYTWGFETLFLHEAVPGHHFQISLAQENQTLPSFQRFGDYTAFLEGWALYSESLGQELGLFTDPYQWYGHLNDEMLRAMRLVVDTGLHAQGWTREQAITYMRTHSTMSQTDATAEVERYIAMPGQALAYKVGQLTIRRLRTEAEHALGSRFDARDFHAQVLQSGALPLVVLEQKIHAWVTARQAR